MADGGDRSDEMEFMERREHDLRDLACFKEVDSSCFPMAVRRIIVEWVVRASFSNKSNIEKAMCIIDTNWAFHSSLSAAMAELPAMCVAVCKLLADMDGGEDGRYYPRARAAERWAAGLDALTERLREQGHLEANPETPPLSVLQSQQLVLKRMRWQLVFSSTEDWIALFAERLDAETRGTYTPSLNWAMAHSPRLAMVLMLQARFTDLPIKSRAMGMFFYQLVQAKLISVDMLRPDSAIGGSWAQSFAVQQHDLRVPRCEFSDQVQRDILGAAQRALKTDTAGLQESLVAVVDAISQEYSSVL